LSEVLELLLGYKEQILPNNDKGFSTLVQIKSKQRKILYVEDDLRCALLQTLANIQLLSDEKQ